MSLAVKFGWIALAAGLATGQTPLTFEVASIRLHAGPNRGVGITLSGSRVTVTNSSVLGLITYAHNLEPYQVTGGPGWVSDYASYGWDITASAGSEAITRDQAKLMMRALLADRFQLRLHRETKEMPVYALVLAGKGGTKLKPSAPDAEGMMRMSGGRTIKVETTAGSLEQLVTQLSGTLRTPVLDKTGMTGNYDYKLEWAPENAAPDVDAPTLFTALQEQLGLQLESRKAPVEAVVIDHAEKPSEN
ncbi:MAG TPA: TIGR03435 family protein [Bryobacteraceae bacterium]|jgi:uncharacterized protein (TIGR03435 family)